MRCAVWAGLLAMLGLSGCATVTWWDPLGLHLPGEKSFDQAIVGRSLTTLSSDGDVYPFVTAGTVARSWAENLKRLGLPTHIDEANCVHCATPDGHAFSINVVVATDMGDESGSHARAYLHWQERDYGTRGWQVLTDLENQQRAATPHG
jgi:hypothetical protein